MSRHPDDVEVVFDEPLLITGLAYVGGEVLMDLARGTPDGPQYWDSLSISPELSAALTRSSDRLKQRTNLCR